MVTGTSCFVWLWHWKDYIVCLNNYTSVLCWENNQLWNWNMNSSSQDQVNKKFPSLLSDELHNPVFCTMCELLEIKPIPPSGRNPVTVVMLCGWELSCCTKLSEAVTAMETLPKLSLCSSSTDRLLLLAVSGRTHKSKVFRCFRNLFQSWETSEHWVVVFHKRYCTITDINFFSYIL